MSGEKVYLPKQEMREGRGEAGYVDLEGNIEVVDKPDPERDTYQGDSPKAAKIIKGAKRQGEPADESTDQPAEGNS